MNVASSGCPCRGGGYLLSHFRSTIGVVRFNFSVRNGKRWNPHAIATLVFSFSAPASSADAVGVERTPWGVSLETFYGNDFFVTPIIKRPALLMLCLMA